VPALGALAALLVLSSWLVLQTQPAERANGEQVLYTPLTEGPFEGPEDDLLLGAALLEERVR
jgi:hypothetical protein